MKVSFKKIVPDKATLERQKVLRPIAHWIAEPKLWYFNRRATAKGVAIGVFFGCLPIVGQMFLSAVVAIFFKSNIPVAIAATWISNPFTMPFLYTANYFFGTWLLRYQTVDIGHIQWSFDSLVELGGEVLVPLFFGSTVVGVIMAILSLIGVRLFWRLRIISRLQSKKRCQPLPQNEPDGDPDN